MASNKGLLKIIVIVAIVFAGLYLLQNCNRPKFMKFSENYEDVPSYKDLENKHNMPVQCDNGGGCDIRIPSPPQPCASDAVHGSPTCPGQVVDKCGSYQNVSETSCFPKSQLTPDDLLPSDECNVWSKNNPHGSGSLANKNFLQAGWATGVSSVGSTLRNANLQLRSDPPNPQVAVSPWMQTTIQPDVGRKPLELGSA